MNKNEILKLIKDKAQEKDIPNVSMLIKDKLKDNTYVAEEIISPQKRFSLRPLTLSLTAIFIIVIMFLIFLTNETNQPDLLLNAAFSDQVLLSALSTIDLVGIDDESLTHDQHAILLAAGDTSGLVEDQMDGVLKYSYFMETFLSNKTSLPKEYVNKAYGSYKKAITYKLSNLTNEEVTYEFYYKQKVHKETYEIQGLLKTNEKDYPFTISGNIKDHQFKLTYQNTNQQQIEVHYQELSGEHHLKIKKYDNKVLTEEALIAYSNKDRATLSFVKGQTKGIYQFSLGEMMGQMRKMKIDYQIDRTDEGMIEIELSKENFKKYILNIRPKDRPASIIEKVRKNRKNKNQGNNN